MSQTGKFTEIDAIKRLLSTKEARISDLSGTVKKLTAQLTETRKQHAADISRLENDLASLEAAREASETSALARLQTFRAESERAARAAAESADEQIQSLDAHINAMEEQHLTQLEALEAQMADQRDRSAAEVAALQAEIVQLRAQAAEETQALAARAEGYRDERNALRKDIMELQDHLHALQAELRAERQSVRAVRAEADALINAARTAGSEAVVEAQERFTALSAQLLADSETQRAAAAENLAKERAGSLERIAGMEKEMLAMKERYETIVEQKQKEIERLNSVRKLEAESASTAHESLRRECASISAACRAADQACRAAEAAAADAAARAAAAASASLASESSASAARVDAAAAEARANAATARAAAAAAAQQAAEAAANEARSEAESARLRSLAAEGERDVVLADSAAALSDLREELEQARASGAQAAAEAAGTREELTKVREELRASVQEVDSLTRALEIAENKVINLESALSQSQGEAAENAAECRRTMKILESVRETEQKLSDQIVVLNSELKTTRRDLASANEAVTAANHRVSEQAMLATHAREELRADHARQLAALQSQAQNGADAGASALADVRHELAELSAAKAALDRDLTVALRGRALAEGQLNGARAAAAAAEERATVARAAAADAEAATAAAVTRAAAAEAAAAADRAAAETVLAEGSVLRARVSAAEAAAAAARADAEAAGVAADARVADARAAAEAEIAEAHELRCSILAEQSSQAAAAATRENTIIEARDSAQQMVTSLEQELDAAVARAEAAERRAAEAEAAATAAGAAATSTAQKATELSIQLDHVVGRAGSTETALSVARERALVAENALSMLRERISCLSADNNAKSSTLASLEAQAASSTVSSADLELITDQICGMVSRAERALGERAETINALTDRLEELHSRHIITLNTLHRTNAQVTELTAARDQARCALDNAASSLAGRAGLAAAVQKADEDSLVSTMQRLATFWQRRAAMLYAENKVLVGRLAGAVPKNVEHVNGLQRPRPTDIGGINTDSGLAAATLSVADFSASGFTSPASTMRCPASPSSTMRSIASPNASLRSPNASLRSPTLSLRSPLSPASAPRPASAAASTYASRPEDVRRALAAEIQSLRDRGVALAVVELGGCRYTFDGVRAQCATDISGKLVVRESGSYVSFTHWLHRSLATLRKATPESDPAPAPEPAPEPTLAHLNGNGISTHPDDVLPLLEAYVAQLRQHGAALRLAPAAAPRPDLTWVLFNSVRASVLVHRSGALAVRDGAGAAVPLATWLRNRADELVLGHVREQGTMGGRAVEMQGVSAVVYEHNNWDATVHE